ncbi:sensor histidine kinase [Lutispora saccharofermentans]|uniref:GHKL domain-containing protein n=1 Tax=Lutispora saccharofermentans TaxID=3024236 RepID=A0ABT1NMV7_9FIRM|nr:GHKL domain-containing protein [Lutispora saccharofermentans]MCQ1531453.1 GHKL domain-containing protein [Lutispora saccharofermentans]
MSGLFPDLLRAVISTTANVLLMMTLLQPKYSKKITLLTMLGILAADLGTAIYCYLSGNLTLLSKLDIVLFAVLCFAVRPLFKDTFMQWLFSYLTVQNISDAVIIISFIGSRHLPYPAYANSLLRLALFGTFLLILSRHVRPLYRQAVEHWTAYFAVALGIYITFNHYVLSSDDIVVTLTEQAVPLLLVIFIGLAAYGSIFLSLKNLQREFRVKEENRKMQVEREYLQLAAGNMSRRLELMAEVSAQNSRAAHDRRHFNNVLLELLEQGKTGEAYALLQSQNQAAHKISKVYCENPAVNAAVCHYAGLAEQAGIRLEIALDIPGNVTVDALELSMVVSNLMENAIQACERLPKEQVPYLRFTCRSVGRLLLEMGNPCAEGTSLDESGYPVACKEGHGVGSKSVITFAKKYDGELMYRIENGVFRVRLLV